MGTEIKIPENCSYSVYLRTADQDRSGTINSQSEVTRVAELIDQSGDMDAYFDFAEQFVPQAERQGWYFPTLFRINLEAPLTGCSESEEEESKEAGCPPHVENPQTIREAIRNQCGSNKQAISFPAYAVTTAQGHEPVLRTTGLSTCLGIVIYHPPSSQTLLGHFPTDFYRWTHGGLEEAIYQIERGDQSDNKVRSDVSIPFEPVKDDGVYAQLPMEWYVATFRWDYFQMDPENIQIHIVTTLVTPKAALESMLQGIQAYFPEASVWHREAQSYGAIRYQIDSRRGLVEIEPSTCNWGMTDINDHHLRPDCDASVLKINVTQLR